MRMIAIAFALAFTACASAPKGAPQKDRPVRRAVVAPLDDGRVVSLLADGAWAPLPRKPNEPVVLQHQDVRSAAVALFFRQAELGSAVEDEVNRWAMMMLSGPMVFRVTGVTNPVYPSETQGSFTMTGVGEKGMKMSAKCLVVHLGDPTADYWVLILSVSPAAMETEAFAQVDKISKSLKLNPPE